MVRITFSKAIQADIGAKKTKSGAGKTIFVLDRALSQTEISDLMTRGGIAKNLVIGNSAPAQIDINNSEPVFNMYPNPNTGSNLTIEISNLNSEASTMLQIFDIIGKMVYTNQIEADSSSKTMNIQTEGLKKGMYIVSITNGANTQNMKQIIK